MHFSRTRRVAGVSAMLEPRSQLFDCRYGTGPCAPVEANSHWCYVLVADLKSNIEHCRAKAAEAEARARDASDETSRSLYLEAARSWAALARMTEELMRHSRG
jgi:hypothetical protein